jgi:endonuclease G
MLWGNIENYIASESKSEGKLNVFNGPVFRHDDRTHRGLQIPREFWKVVTYIRDDGKPGAAAFVLSQADLIDDLAAEQFTPGAFKPSQVAIAQLERKIGLDISAITSWDSKKADGRAKKSAKAAVGEEAMSVAPLERTLLARLSDIQL